MSVWSFRPEPQGQPLTPGALLTSGLEAPLSMPTTFSGSTAGGFLLTPGIGTAIRRFTLPDEAPAPDLIFTPTGGDPIAVPDQPYYRTEIERQARSGAGTLRTETPTEFAARVPAVPGAPVALSEEDWKQSAHFREGIPWDAGMTNERAAALAEMYDVRKVREFYGAKRPITEFFGTLAGSAADPVNYIPVFDGVVAAANIARFGKIGGRAITASMDAAANVGLAGAATADERAKFGDDVSWQAQLNQIAMGALIGAAFGTIHGGARAYRERGIDAKLATVANTQKALATLNEQIDVMARDGTTRVGPASQEFIDSTARSEDITAIVSAEEAVRAAKRAPPPKKPARMPADPESKMPGYPVLNMLKNLGGVKPGSPLAQELDRLGVSTLTHPWVFNKRGLGAVDNVPRSEHPLFSEDASAQDLGGYLDQEEVIAAIADEMSGFPKRTQAQLEKIDAFKAQMDAFEPVQREAGPQREFAPLDAYQEQGLPPVASGSVRFYHGGVDPTSGGDRFVSPDFQYARDFGGGPNDVSYVDIPQDAIPDVFDDINGIPRNGPIPEEWAKKLKPMPQGASPSPEFLTYSSPNVKPETTPEPERLEAEQRVGKPEALSELATAAGIKAPKDGGGQRGKKPEESITETPPPESWDDYGYKEQDDVNQLRAEKGGKLNTEDEAAIAASDELFRQADAYGDAFEAAMACIIGEI